MHRVAGKGSISDNIAEPPARAGWPDFSLYRPHPPAARLRDWLAEAHQLTRTLTRFLDSERLDVPMLPIVNPPLWELGHIAWFQEFWLHRGGDFAAPPMLVQADRWYDSARVAHDTRWSLDLPDVRATRAYADAVFGRTLALLDGAALSDERAYFAQLAIFHQDMHNEAFCYMWQTLAYPMPVAWPEAGASVAADIEVPAGTLALGAAPGSGFVFDNEKWAHEVSLPAFAIARRALSNAEYRGFVEDGGYARRELWSAAGWAMRERLGLAHPRYWRREADTWSQRRYDRWLPLAAEAPVTHVSCHEAEAYCAWAGRRLPAEAEWECAAGAFADRFDSGRVWEWTSSRFAPYPGFSADPYKEYSAPWFAEEHRVLRGGSFVTPPRLLRKTWRNFYQPERADLFCGFRTCAK
jgi:iron(II)-dependent oxidoreductase